MPSPHTGGVFQKGIASPRFQNLTGKVFHRLTVKSYAGKQGKHHYWFCECECGNTKRVSSTNLKTENTKSCGCLNRELTIEKNHKHGLAHHPLYNRAKGQQQRCNNPEHPSYQHYGGRGIKCQWDNLEEHVRAMEEEIGLPPSPDMEIDRIDNNGHYESGNLRWVTKKENLYNSRNPTLLKAQGLLRKAKPKPPTTERNILSGIIARHPVCDEWKGRGGLQRFLADMGEMPSGCWLKRPDETKPFSKENCSWAKRPNHKGVRK